MTDKVLMKNIRFSVFNVFLCVYSLDRWILITLSIKFFKIMILEIVLTEFEFYSKSLKVWTLKITAADIA